MPKRGILHRIEVAVGVFAPPFGATVDFQILLGSQRWCWTGSQKPDYQVRMRIRAQALCSWADVRAHLGPAAAHSSRHDSTKTRVQTAVCQTNVNWRLGASEDTA